MDEYKISADVSNYAQAIIIIQAANDEVIIYLAMKSSPEIHNSCPI